MTQIFSFKSAAIICVATLAMCFAGQDANAQCRGGGGFGGGGFGGGGVSIGYSSGFRGNSFGGFGGSNFGGFGGPSYGGGFNRGVSVNVFRPSYSGSSFYRGGSSFGHGGFNSGFYGRSPYRSSSRFRY